MPGTAKMIFDIMFREPWAQPALQAENQHVDQSRYHWRDRKRQVDERNQQILAAEFKFGDRPCGRYAEDQIERHRNRGRRQSKLDR